MITRALIVVQQRTGAMEISKKIEANQDEDLMRRHRQRVA